MAVNVFNQAFNYSVLGTPENRSDQRKPPSIEMQKESFVNIKQTYKSTYQQCKNFENELVKFKREHELLQGKLDWVLCKVRQLMSNWLLSPHVKSKFESERNVELLDLKYMQDI